MPRHATEEGWLQNMSTTKGVVSPNTQALLDEGMTEAAYVVEDGKMTFLPCDDGKPYEVAREYVRNPVTGDGRKRVMWHRDGWGSPHATKATDPVHWAEIPVDGKIVGWFSLNPHAK
jgi:hypothetical protein